MDRINTLGMWSIATVLGLACVSCQAVPKLPSARIELHAVSLNQLWLQAELVFVGSVSGVRSLGASQVVRLPNGGVVTVHACQAKFAPTGLIKGTTRGPTGRFLWFSYSRDCQLAGWPYGPGMLSRAQKDPDATVWFFREEEGWLRPIDDNAAAYLALAEPLPLDADEQELQLRFARALLSTANILPELGGFASRFSDFYGLACYVVGEATAYSMLADLQRHAAPNLRNEICRFLAFNYHQCEFATCPEGSLYPGMSAPDKERAALQTQGDSLGISDRALAGMRSDPAKRELLYRLLLLRSCHVDPSIRRRSRLLLEENFPGQTATCVACR